MEMEGNIDLHGLLALDDSVSPGYEQIRMKMDIQADCSDEELDELVAYSRDHSHQDDDCTVGQSARRI